MNHLRFGILRLLVAAAVILILAPAIPAVEENNDGKATLERTAEFYEKLQTMRSTVEIRIEIPEGFPAMPSEPERFRFALARPASVSALPAGDQPGPSFVQDGERQYADFPPFRRYTLGPSLALPELLRAPESGAMAIPGLNQFLAFGLEAPVPGSLRGAGKATHLGEESIDGVACVHLRLEDPAGSNEIWIAKGERPWVMRYHMDPPAEPPPPEKTEGGEMMMMFTPGVDIRFRDWEVDPDLSGAFSIQPREEYQKVEVLFPPPEEMGDFFGEMEGPHASIGEPAPDVRLKPLDGEPVDLSSLKGKVVVLDFWATWCVPCIFELPVVSSVTKELGERGVVFYAIDRGETVETVQSFLRERKMDLPVVMDTDDSISSAFGVVGMPHLVVIDRSGTIHSVHFGSAPGSEKRLRAELESLLGT